MLKFILELLNQIKCSLRGHDKYMILEDDRMFLKCQSCSYESLGWRIGD